MSLKDYSVKQLLAEVERRANVPKRKQITFTDLGEDLAKRIFDTRKNLEKDRSLHKYTFEIMYDTEIYVEYRNLLVDGDVETDLEHISIVVQRFPPTRWSDKFISFFFEDDGLLEDFFWRHLHDDLPCHIVDVEDIEELVKCVQAELDIPESEAYDIVNRLLGVE